MPYISVCNTNLPQGLSGKKYAGGQIFKIAASRFVNVSEEKINLMKENMTYFFPLSPRGRFVLQTEIQGNFVENKLGHYSVLFDFGHIRRWDQCAVFILYSKISTDPGLLKIRHSHRFVAVVIQILILFMNHTRKTIWRRIIRVCMGFSTRYP